ncbi:MAG: hypothetical protein K9M94_07160 [Spirochaetia bacterium]|nr:hypothetical protein [Spirochaetia bacterium]
MPYDKRNWTELQGGGEGLGLFTGSVPRLPTPTRGLLGPATGGAGEAGGRTGSMPGLVSCLREEHFFQKILRRALCFDNFGGVAYITH